MLHILKVVLFGGGQRSIGTVPVVVVVVVVVVVA